MEVKINIQSTGLEAQEKQVALQKIANVLTADNLNFLASLTKGNNVNDVLKSKFNRGIIKSKIK